MLNEIDAIGFVQRNFPGCELPIISRSVLPHTESYGIYGAGLAALILATTFIGFQALRTEEARYRLVAVIHTVAWPIVLLAVMQFFLATYALPFAKCAA
jgi:hypothetical protein